MFACNFTDMRLTDTERVKSLRFSPHKIKLALKISMSENEKRDDFLILGFIGKMNDFTKRENRSLIS